MTLEPVYCLGLCACAPSAMLDGEVIGRLDDDRLDEIVAEVQPMTVPIYVPGDSGALALGADKVAQAIEREIADARLDASRSCATARAALYWLEPMVEVETPTGPRRLWAGRGQGRAVACSMPGFLDGGDASRCRSAIRGDPVPASARRA